MAIFYCQTTPLGRSGGRSAVAAAAYRSGQKLTDERTGEVHDYTRRSGVASTDLVLPEGAPALDRGELWNQAEAAEARKDARTAREWVIALPDELPEAERRALALEFAGALVQRYGVAVDVAIHQPGREGDQRNHHAHLLTTTRRLGPDGFGAKADIELSDKARAARGLGPARSDVEAVRETWARMANTRLEQAGQAARIDHRTLKAQGIEDREPTRKLGPAATAMERRTGAKSQRRQGQETGAAERAEARQAAAELRKALVQEAAGATAELAGIEAQLDTLRKLKMPPAIEPEPPKAPALSWTEQMALDQEARYAAQRAAHAARLAALSEQLEKERQAARSQQQPVKEQAKPKAPEAPPKQKQTEERDRAQIGSDFRSMAIGREAKAFGYTDSSDKWRAMPAELKAKIEAYNRLPKEQRPRALEKIGADPRTAELIRQAREISRGRSR